MSVTHLPAQTNIEPLELPIQEPKPVVPTDNMAFLYNRIIEAKMQKLPQPLLRPEPV